MMHIFDVTFVSKRDCSFYLNNENFLKLTKNEKSAVNCIEVKFGEEFDRSIYANFKACSDIVDDFSIGINADKARLLGIDENEKVCVSVARAPLLRRVCVRLQDGNEYNLVHKNINLLENVILDYVQIVNLYEIIPIKVQNGVVINLKVENLNVESHYGKLQKETEMVVLPPSSTGGMETTDLCTIETRSSESKKENQVTAMIFKMFKWPKKEEDGMKYPSYYQESKTAEDIQAELLSQFSDERDTLFRIMPCCFAPENIRVLVKSNTVVATRLPDSVKAPLSCKIYRMEEWGISKEKIDFEIPSKWISSQLITPGDNVDKRENILYVSDYCMKSLNVKCGAGVRIEPFAEHRNGMVAHHYDTFDPITLLIENYSFTESVKKIYDDVKRTIVDNVKHHQRINTLINGSTGNGKTYLLNVVAETVELMHLSWKKIDCKNLQRIKASNLEKILIQSLTECCRSSPSVMIIEDLDSLAMDAGETGPYEGMYSARIGDMFLDLITSYQNNSEITFIASCTSLTKLKHISTDRGPIIFGNIHEIKELDLNERCYLLRRLMMNKQYPELNESLVEEIGNKTKGYNVQDLVDLIEIAEFKLLLRSISGEGGITREDFESALAEKVPASLCGVKLHKKTMTKWEDIGGMENTKNLLKEMFDWPLRYPELYGSCPIRLQCGVLLYGGPGTGKTLIAGAVADEFGLNFIKIKGPEIFSKYVGASEQGVRDLFSRAKKAKPCLLFFDEFESLARKRGDSNQDVNDRVVNQLLTELDGVEELTGVYILAATSRPDLLDPALLRPGRIDKTIHCKLPTQTERLFILKALSKKLTLSEDVDLEEIAEKTDGYSGADLQAVLRAAQMILVKEAEKVKAVDSRPSYVLKQRHLLSGLAETKPSTSREERQKYEASYEAFIASRTKRLGERFGHTQQRVMFA